MLRVRFGDPADCDGNGQADTCELAHGAQDLDNNGVRDDGVAVITLNAPSRMNSMSRKMNTGVQVALDLAAERILALASNLSSH